MEVRNVDNTDERGKVTITCDFDLPSCQRILTLFSEDRFTVEKIDSGRRTPVVEFNGRYFTGSKDIMMHFFPGK